MDFSKIKPAVDEITLSDEQKENIINACSGKKRSSFRKPLTFAAAAAAVVIITLTSPGFLFRAKSSDKAFSENLQVQDTGEIYVYSDYEDCQTQYGSGSVSVADIIAFEAENFSPLYTVIPAEFIPLAGEEFDEWVSELSADDGMAIFQLVNRFGIERRDFDSANIAYAARTGVYFNADIIYTLDKEQVDSFYLK